ncbi:MAG: hypothetical protein A3G33_02820 [Omnitrophica bacterium RIFCSPLOWO2_12_FULL_44_17]|uniref:Uncharacterized protein n=1 Tax=Candidatus Danuiimicrobium aquiferis TaxID=1801832 RepID=A0A1G1KVJ1_9BACT|nr:MAG: hypothetical protein A3B72_04300 [Omnitrophica bacterium RIFCSPHIGHO2_02_FULL_45_28]OGW92580.1 MAG: hypothetical protein A3E74_09660 [Omnitrophica bacterium RIFCSPHIGHO2_12_FULL_44_12]OGW96911.1 MAG: hypothetical protein A3G33_02820 [Omnitrophica bacterium RIFCSPLOWO2_12_FULL_44_17]OGX01818.1 MAG: hypothetical protein A3J12_01665 [Omnitrophica bacterium RIFCSPLOWO2_02_FULL_44_11]
MKFIHIVQFLIFQSIFVGIVIYFLRKIFYADTDSAINRLGSVHEDMQKKQQELAQKIDLAEKEYQNKKDEAIAIKDKLQAQAVDESRKKKDEMMKEAKVEADALIDKAVKSSAKHLKDIEKNFNVKVIEFSAALIRSIFSEETLKKIHQDFVADFLTRSKDLDLTSVSEDISDLTIKTALPLEEEVKVKLNTMIQAKLKREITFTEVVDKELVAGILLQLGTLVLDVSVSNAIREKNLEMRRDQEIANR